MVRGKLRKGKEVWGVVGEDEARGEGNRRARAEMLWMMGRGERAGWENR